MCKNCKKVAKWPILRKFPRATGAGLRNDLRSEFARTPSRWPEVRLRHGPIARWPGGVARSLRWETFCAPESSLVVVVVVTVACVLTSIVTHW